MKRIRVDMDEALAKYTLKVIRTLKEETGFEIDLEKIKGRFLSKSLSQQYVDKITQYPYREGFFRDLVKFKGTSIIFTAFHNVFGDKIYKG